MGKIVNSSNQHVSGKVGNMIYYTMYGKQYTRTRPTAYHDAKSEEQRNVRVRFTAVNIFQRAMIGTYFHAIWKIAAREKAMSGANLFVHNNSKAFDKEGLIADFSKISLSVGQLPLPDNIECGTDNDGVTTLCWKNQYTRFSPRYFDRLRIGILFSDAPFEAILLDGVQAMRHEGRATFRMPQQMGVIAHLYCFFASEDEDAYSNDWYTKIG